MALNKPAKTNKEYFTIPEDTYIAKLYSVVDLGDQDTGFTDPDTGANIIQTRVMLTYEVQDCLMDDGRPAVISTGPSGINVSLNERATLRKYAHAALGSRTDEISDGTGTVGDALKEMLDKPVLLTVTHKTTKKGHTIATIGQVSPLPKKDLKDVKPTINDLVFVEDANSVDPETYAKIPKFIQTLMVARLNALNTGDDKEVY